MPRPKPGARAKGLDGESYVSETPDANGFYHALVSMGPGPDGKPDRRHIMRKDRNAVRAKVKQLEADREAGRPAKKGKTPTVREMLERHLEVTLVARKRAPKTIYSYRSLCEKWIYPLWGNHRIDRLRDEVIEDGVATMLARGLAPSSVRKVLVVLSSAYELQVRRGVVPRNPCVTVDPPKMAATEAPSLTEDQARRVIRIAVGRANAARWSVGLAQGLRQGEALGLRWEFLDIDVPEGKTGKMRVWWQLQRLPWLHGCADHDPEYRNIIAEPDRRKRRAEIEHACGEQWHKRPCPKRCPKKRASGRPHVCVTADAKGLCRPSCTKHAAQCPRRKDGGLVFRPVKENRPKTIPVAPELAAILREHRGEQLLQKLTVAEHWQDHDLVFCQWNGLPIDPRTDWQEWSDILAEAGIAHVGVHSGRHAAATIAIEMGVALPVVQEILGHSDIRVTRKYVTVSSDLADDMARRMGRRLLSDDE